MAGGGAGWRGQAGRQRGAGHAARAWRPAPQQLRPAHPLRSQHALPHVQHRNQARRGAGRGRHAVPTRAVAQCRENQGETIMHSLRCWAAPQPRTSCRCHRRSAQPGGPGARAGAPWPAAGGRARVLAGSAVCLPWQAHCTGQGTAVQARGASARKACECVRASSARHSAAAARFSNAAPVAAYNRIAVLNSASSMCNSPQTWPPADLPVLEGRACGLGDGRGHAVQLRHLPVRQPPPQRARNVVQLHSREYTLCDFVCASTPPCAHRRAQGSLPGQPWQSPAACSWPRGWAACPCRCTSSEPPEGQFHAQCGSGRLRTHAAWRSTRMRPQPHTHARQLQRPPPARASSGAPAQWRAAGR